MAFPPPDGREAVRTVECGNAGLQGEHLRKRVRNGGIQDRAGAWRISDAASIRKVLGHRHPGAVTELLRARGDGHDGALGRVLAEGCSRRYSEVARYASVASASQPAENDLGANRLSYGRFLAVTDERGAFRLPCGRASIALSPTRATRTMGSRRSTRRSPTRH